MTDQTSKPRYNDDERIAVISEAQKGWRSGISEQDSPYHPFISNVLSSSGNVPMFNLSAYIVWRGFVKAGGFADLSNVVLFDVTQTFISMADLSNTTIRSVLQDTTVTSSTLGGNGLTVVSVETPAAQGYDVTFNYLRGVFTLTTEQKVASLVACTLRDIHVALNQVILTGSTISRCQGITASNTIIAAMTGIYNSSFSKLDNVTLAGFAEAERPMSLARATGTITFQLRGQDVSSVYPGTNFQGSNLTITGSMRNVDLTGSNFTGATINGTTDAVAALTALGYDNRRYPVITASPSA